MLRGFPVTFPVALDLMSAELLRPLTAQGLHWPLGCDGFRQSVDQGKRVQFHAAHVEWRRLFTALVACARDNRRRRRRRHECCAALAQGDIIAKVCGAGRTMRGRPAVWKAGPPRGPSCNWIWDVEMLWMTGRTTQNAANICGLRATEEGAALRHPGIFAFRR